MSRLFPANARLELRIMNNGRHKLLCDGKLVPGVCNIRVEAEDSHVKLQLDLYAGAVKLSTEETPSADQ